MSAHIDAISLHGAELRELAEADLGELQALFERCPDYFLAHEGRPPAAGEARDEWDSVPAGTPRSHLHILGVFAADLVGVVEVLRDWPRPGTWNIGLLLLEPATRGRGLGDRVMRAVDALATRRGADTLRISAIPANTRGMAFWKRLGFAPVPAAGTHPTAIALERPVASGR